MPLVTRENDGGQQEAASLSTTIDARRSGLPSGGTRQYVVLM